MGAKMSSVFIVWFSNRLFLSAALMGLLAILGGHMIQSYENSAERNMYLAKDELENKLKFVNISYCILGTTIIISILTMLISALTLIWSS